MIPGWLRRKVYQNVLWLIVAATSVPLHAQETRDSSETGSLLPATIVSAAFVGTTLVQNYYDFWKNSGRVPFHISNDPPYALHNDKLGHVYYSALASGIIRDCYAGAGVDRRTAGWIGAGTALFAQTLVEISDGVRGGRDYLGFSPGDEAANILGSAFPLAQEYLPYLRRFDFKIGLWPSEALKQGVYRSILHDNESQFFWMSMDIHDHIGGNYPAWLNIAIGYGVENLSASGVLQGTQNLTPNSLLYLGLDLNLKGLPIEGKVWKIIAELLSYYRIPFPALQVTPVVKWRWAKP